MFEAEALLIVEDRFLIQGSGLVLTPLLDVPADDRRFFPFADVVLIRRPDGSEMKLPARWDAAHFCRSTGKSGWNIVLLLPTESKETVPIGSSVFVTKEAHLRIRGEAPKKHDEANA